MAMGEERHPAAANADRSARPWLAAQAARGVGAQPGTSMSGVARPPPRRSAACHPSSNTNSHFSPKEGHTTMDAATERSTSIATLPVADPAAYAVLTRGGDEQRVRQLFDARAADRACIN